MSKNALSTFTFGSSLLLRSVAIRVVTIDGEPWFVAADIMRVLGWSVGPLGNNFANLGVDEKGVEVVDTLGGPQRLRIVSESGLYKLIMRSDKPQAKPFQDWVTKVVLPAIRKDGAYIMDEEKVATGEMSEDELVLRAYDILKTKVQRLTEERDEAVKGREGA
jgi:prophage antirepressor-like protein